MVYQIERKHKRHIDVSAHNYISYENYSDIFLKNGECFQVSNEDLDWVLNFKWCVDTKGYIQRSYSINGVIKKAVLHRVICEMMELNINNQSIDHIDCNRLNNCRNNLRIATRSQNNFNQKIRSNNTSNYKGVSWCKQAGKWRVRIYIDKKEKHVGFFDCPIKGAIAYDIRAFEEYGEFAHFNFPDKIKQSISEKNNYVKIIQPKTSKFKGVSWNTQRMKWHSLIKINGKQKHLGFFDCPIEAAIAFDRAAVEYRGEFVKLNFPEDYPKI